MFYIWSNSYREHHRCVNLFSFCSAGFQPAFRTGGARCSRFLVSREDFRSAGRLFGLQGGFSVCSEDFRSAARIFGLQGEFSVCREAFRSAARIFGLQGEFSVCREAFRSAGSKMLPLRNVFAKLRCSHSVLHSLSN
jgi:hypothetical protein